MLARRDRQPEDRSNPIHEAIGLIQSSSDQSRLLLSCAVFCLQGRIPDQCEHTCEPVKILASICAPIGPIGLYKLALVASKQHTAGGYDGFDNPCIRDVAAFISLLPDLSVRGGGIQGVRKVL